MLAKYGIGSNGTDTIPLFSLQSHEIQDYNMYFEHCLAEILVRLKNYGSLVVDSLEAMRNEYVMVKFTTWLTLNHTSIKVFLLLFRWSDFRDDIKLT